MLCTMRLITMSLSAAACLALASCAARGGGFEAADATARLRAIQEAAQRNDRAAIPRLVEQLDADDAAVRAMAIATLRRLTGEDYGYRDYDPPELRRTAIQRWMHAVDQHPAAGSDDPDAAYRTSDNRG